MASPDQFPSLETARLFLRVPEAADAAGLLALVNDPGWLRFIGDTGARDIAAAEVLIETRYRTSFAAHGFGLFSLVDRSDGRFLGLCGLVRRPGLEHPDLGFAVLPQARGQGLVTEAARAVLEHARRDLNLSALDAVSLPDNGASHRVLEGLGFVRAGAVVLPGETEPSTLHFLDLAGVGGNPPGSGDSP